MVEDRKQAGEGGPGELSPDQVERGLKLVLAEGVALQAMLTFSGGAFLVAFALKMGASNLLIGLLSAIPPLAQLLQIPGILLLKRAGSRRRLTAGASSAGRASLLLLVLIPFVAGPETGVWLVMAAVLWRATLAAISNLGWNSWMRDLVPADRMGGFYSKRKSLITLTSAVLGLMAALYLDLWQRWLPGHALQGYSLLFLASLAGGMAATSITWRIPEPPFDKPAGGLVAQLVQPFKDRNFRNLIWFLGWWNFAVNLAAPFFTVYMLKSLGYDMLAVISFSVLSQLTSVFFYRFWGKVADRHSNQTVLQASGPLFMVCLLGWTFVTFPEQHFLTVPLLVLLHLGMGISTAGTNLATGNIATRLAPREQATAYLAAVTVINSLAAGIAPILGGKSADFFAARKLALSLSWQSPYGEKAFNVIKFTHWDFFFVLAFLVGIFSLYRLGKVSEPGGVGREVVLGEFFSQVRLQIRNFSTVGGLRDLSEFPFAVLARAAHLARHKAEEDQAGSRRPL